MTATRPDALPTLGDAYTIERELGGGGMSRVFVATEVALKRRVVVKVLGRELAEGLSAERFAREIELAAALQDPHIVPVHATGTTGEGLPYFTMPYVEGESLRMRLTRGVVPLDDALRILRDVAEALEYAHARGVVHRDIKPENILLSGRSAVVADFGIAKAVSAARLSGSATRGATLTSVGVSLGTPAYMSPEQAVGDTTDHRTDLYAWGMVAYEVLAGAHPFAAYASTAQLVKAQVSETPRALDAVRPGLPPALGTLIMHCLAKMPNERPADAAAVLAALGGATTDLALTSGRRAPVAVGSPTRRVRQLVAAALVGLAAGGAWWAARQNTAAAATTLDATPSIAVLPFEHQGDSTGRYLTEGITDEIRGRLAGVRDLLVIARGSSVQYRGAKKAPREIAEELGVRYLLTGTVQVSGTGEQRRVIVRPELVEITPSGQPQSRWGQPFEAQGTDVLGLQGSIASQVVGAMAGAVSGADRAQLVQVPTKDPIAYDLLLRARAATEYNTDQSLPALREAAALYERALDRDSTLVDAWVELTRTRAQLYARWVTTAAMAEATRDAAERARTLDPQGGRGDRAMGFYLTNVRKDVAAAAAAYERVYRAAPGEPSSVNNLGLVRSQQGRLDEALRLFVASARMDPRNATSLRNQSRLLRGIGRLAEARAITAQLQQIAPTAILTLLDRLADDLAIGDTVAARRTLVEGLRAGSADRLLPAVLDSDAGWLLAPAAAESLFARGPSLFGDDRGYWAGMRADYHWLWGNTSAQRAWGDSARTYIEQQLRELPQDHAIHAWLGNALAHTGQRDQSIREMQASINLLIASGMDRRSTAHSARLYVAAITATIAGDHDRALSWLEEHLAQPTHRTRAFVRIDPRLAPLRTNPRFQQLMAEAQ